MQTKRRRRRMQITAEIRFQTRLCGVTATYVPQRIWYCLTESPACFIHYCYKQYLPKTDSLTLELVIFQNLNWCENGIIQVVRRNYIRIMNASDNTVSVPTAFFTAENILPNTTFNLKISINRRYRSYIRCEKIDTGTTINCARDYYTSKNIWKNRNGNKWLKTRKFFLFSRVHSFVGDTNVTLHIIYIAAFDYKFNAAAETFMTLDIVQLTAVLIT